MFIFSGKKDRKSNEGSQSNINGGPDQMQATTCKMYCRRFDKVTLMFDMNDPFMQLKSKILWAMVRL